MKLSRIFLLALCCALPVLCPAARAQVLADSEPTVLKEDKPVTPYVHDLKVLIQKSRQSIRNVNEKIRQQAVQKRNQQREDKAREYFLEAQRLTDEG